MRIFREYERGVVFMLGRFWKVKGPGLVLIIPVVQQVVRMDLRTVVFDVPPQDVITRDNVSVKVNAVVYFRVVDPEKAVIQVARFLEATSQLAQTTLRAMLGKHELDELLSERERLNADIQRVLDAQTDAWGIKVSNVEIKDVDINETMIRAIARQAEAERERRAKIIHAEGELQASEKLLQAAQMLAQAAAGDAIALSANADHDCRRQELDDRLPGADRYRQFRHRPFDRGSPQTYFLCCCKESNQRKQLVQSPRSHAVWPCLPAAEWRSPKCRPRRPSRAWLAHGLTHRTTEQTGSAPKSSGPLRGRPVNRVACASLQRHHLNALRNRWFPLQTQRQRVALCRSYLVLNQRAETHLEAADRARAKPGMSFEDDT